MTVTARMRLPPLLPLFPEVIFPPALTGIAASGAPAARLWPAAGKYQIDMRHSRLEVRLRKSGFFAPFADNHVILARQARGAIQGGGAQWNIAIEVPTAGLFIADPHSSDSTRAAITRNMRGPAVMDIQRYPLITLRSAGFKPAPAGNKLLLIADLTLHGATRREIFPLSWRQKGFALLAQGEIYLKLTDFGIHPPRVAMGMVRVKNRFLLRWNLQLRRADAPAG